MDTFIYDVMSVTLPTRLKPFFLIIRDEEYRTQQNIYKLQTEIDLLKYQENIAVRRLTTYAKQKDVVISRAHKDAMKGLKASIEHPIQVERLDRDMISVAKELCVLRCTKTSMEDSLNRTREFKSMLKTITSDNVLRESIQNFNIAMGTSRTEMQKKINEITIAFENNVDAQLNFKESFKTSMESALTDNLASSELKKLGGIIGLNLTTPPTTLGQIPPLHPDYLSSPVMVPSNPPP